MRFIDLIHDRLLARPSPSDERRKDALHSNHGAAPDEPRCLGMDERPSAGETACPVVSPANVLINPIPAWNVDRELIITTETFTMRRPSVPVVGLQWLFSNPYQRGGWSPVTVPETIAALNELAERYDRMTPWDWPR